MTWTRLGPGQKAWPKSAAPWRPSPRSQAQVRFFADADVPGLGKLLAGLRNDLTYPGDPGAVIHQRQRPPCPIANPDVLDTDWIPQIAARGWLIITRDSMISQKRNEITAARSSGAPHEPR